MNIRVKRNVMAVLFVIGWMYLMLLILGATGCSLIKLEREAGDFHEKVTVIAPPKDWKALSYHWYELDLRAGEAATAEQPWADVTNDIGSLLLNVQSYCRAYPVMCATGTNE